jgi:YVTN family beta-propeller protein
VFDGNNVWVANTPDNTVSVLQASNGAPLGTFPVGNAPENLAFDGANIWVSNSVGNTLSKL